MSADDRAAAPGAARRSSVIQADLERVEKKITNVTRALEALHPIPVEGRKVERETELQDELEDLENDREDILAELESDEDDEDEVA